MNNLSTKHKIMSVAIIVVTIICLSVSAFKKMFFSYEKITVKVLQVDSTNNEQSVYKKGKRKAGQVFYLSDNESLKNCGITPSDIKILDIKEDGVKISRDVVKYEKEADGTYTESKDKLVEVVKYDDKVNMYVNGAVPDAPECTPARYSYSIIFVK